MGQFFGFFSSTPMHTEHQRVVGSMNTAWVALNAKIKHCYRDEHLCLFNADYGEHGNQAWLEDSHNVAAVTGHPLLTQCREADLHTLVTTQDDTYAGFHATEGAFCYVNYQRFRNKLSIVTDPLGLRPFYYMHYMGGVIFSTCLNLFKALPVSLSVNHDGVAESAALGYYLSDHTAYNEVQCARPGSALSVSSATGFIKTTYFNWLTLVQEPISVEQAIDNINRDFRACCAKYLGNDTRVLTTLSGGLDSRLIACELKRRNKELVAFNFSQSETQDLSCARAFAGNQQFKLNVVQVDDTQAKSVEQRLGYYWRKQQHPDYASVDRPQIAWSGNGGSVGLGFIYCSEAVYQAACSQNKQKLADAYIEQQFAYLPASVLKTAKRQQGRLKAQIIESLSEFDGIPLQQAYYLFLLLNDQHHHLAVPFENIDEYQMDFCTPIYSWKVLRHMLTVPVAEVRRHNFYLKWLYKHYPEATKVPWQAYPGHMPCPLKLQGDNQWSFAGKKRCKTYAVLRTWLKAMTHGHWFGLHRLRFSLLCLLHVFWLKDATAATRFTNRLMKVCC